MQDKKFDVNLHPHLGIGLWCNGNTPVFGTDIQGSSPCRPTKSFTFIVELFLCPYILNVIKGRKIFLERFFVILPLNK